MAFKAVVARRRHVKLQDALQDLEERGIVERDVNEHGETVYKLTEEGKTIGELLNMVKKSV